jgi:hypothetical protein
MKIVLSQNAIRLILFPLNIIVLVVCITITSYLQSIIPKYKFSDFVFWLLMPAIKIQVMLTAIILVVGLAGNIRYNKCWQGSYSFFLLVLTAIYAVCYVFSQDILYHAENIIPELDKAGAYVYERYDAFNEMNVLLWEPTECVCNGSDPGSSCLQNPVYAGHFYWVYHVPCYRLKDIPDYIYSDIGAKEFIYKNVKHLPVIFEKWELIATIILTVYTVFQFFFFFFVAEASQFRAEEKPIA